MPHENAASGKEKPFPAEPEKIEESAHHAAEEDEADATASAPVSKDDLRPEQINNSHYAEASLTKKLAVFTLTTLLVLIALGLIYVFWPLDGRH